MDRAPTPFDGIASNLQVALLLLVLLATIALIWRLGGIGRQFEHRLPLGVLSLEIPWDAEQGRALRAKLDDDERAAAVEHTNLDFLFLLAYPLLLGLSCSLLSTQLDGKAGVILALLAWATLCAAPLDAIENAGILRLLDGRLETPMARLMSVCAAFKFTLAAGGLLGVLAGLLQVAGRRLIAT